MIHDFEDELSPTGEFAELGTVAQQLIQQAQRTALHPKLVLEVFQSCMILTIGDRPINVNPEQLIRLMSDHVPPQTYSSGLLSEDIIQVGQRGDVYFTVSYRPPKLTGIWLEDVSQALHVPLPGLVLARAHHKAKQAHANYYLVAVTERPKPDSFVYVPPLPNTNHKSICWGNVQRSQIKDEKPHDMTEDWQNLLGSSFNNHQVGQKCRSYKEDIRLLMNELSQKGSQEYPEKELLPLELDNRNSKTKARFSDWIASLQRS